MTVPPVAGLYLAAVAVLGTAGAAKMARPGDTAIALRTAGVHVGRLTPGVAVVRAAAVAELALAVTAMVVGGTTAVVVASLVAVSYAAFAAFVGVALLRRWPLASCGCFGRSDTRPTAGHVAVDAVAAVAALWWALAGAPGVPSVLSGGVGATTALMVTSLSSAAVAVVVLSDPLAQRRRG